MTTEYSKNKNHHVLPRKKNRFQNTKTTKVSPTGEKFLSLVLANIALHYITINVKYLN